MRPHGRVNEGVRMDWKCYCSRMCLYQSQLKGKVLQCSRMGCQNTFYRRRAQIHKVQKSYCSTSCAALVNNLNKPKRIKKIKFCANETYGKIISNALTYCSRKCFNTVRTTYVADDLIKKLQATAKRLGRAATKRELGHEAYMCIRAFGTWNKALIAAGLTPHRSHNERMYKRKNTVAFDGHPCDSISEAIVDNWLTEHNIAHERNTAYPDTNHKADWRIGDNIFVEYFGLAKDSPRYDRSIAEKRMLCRKHGIRLFEIYPSDLYPVIKLENVFANLGSKLAM